MLTKRFVNSAQVLYTLLFGTRIKTKENPEMRELIEDENIELFQEKRNKLRQKAEEGIAREIWKRCGREHRIDRLFIPTRAIRSHSKRLSIYRY